MSYHKDAEEKLSQVKRFVMGILHWESSIEGASFWSNIHDHLIEHVIRARSSPNSGVSGTKKLPDIANNKPIKWWLGDEREAKQQAAKAAMNLHTAMGWIDTPEGHEYWHTVKQRINNYSILSITGDTKQQIPESLISIKPRKTLLLCEQRKE